MTVQSHRRREKVTDTTPLAKLVEEQDVSVVPADSPFKTLDNLIKAWKADPTDLNVGGGSSPEGPDHLCLCLSR